MATKTFYVLNTAATSPGWFGSMQDGGSAPAAANTTYGYSPGTLGVGNYCPSYLGANGTYGIGTTTSNIDGRTAPRAGTGATNTTAGDSFRVGTYTGTFASGTWTFTWVLRPTVTALNGRIRMRVWRSANASGTTPTEITTSTQLGTATGSMSSTTTDYTSTISWAAPAITLSNEYLFFEIEWQEQTTAGSGNSSNALFRVGTSNIVTTDFGIPSTAKQRRSVSLLGTRIGARQLLP